MKWSIIITVDADMAELVDALISGVSAEGCAGSNPVIRTTGQKQIVRSVFFAFRTWILSI